MSVQRVDGVSIVVWLSFPINESTPMKILAVRVESYVQAVPRGPAESGTRGSC